MGAGRILVGISDGDVAAVQRSHEFLSVHTDREVDLVRLGSTGGVAFNELIESDADIVVLLEAGALVGPRWLDLLTRALSRPGVGIAGPSTNRAWNEQSCVRPSRGSGTPDLAGLRRDAGATLRRFGHAARTLSPLYSLGDFCYAVHRLVIDAIGGADPAYGTGPCWEMDVNVRAERAGFEGLWVGGAYVYRPPVADESEPGLETNRRLYQDRFCELRLVGSSEDYQPHCRGDTCAHFALPQLTVLRPGQTRRPVETTGAVRPAQGATPAAPRPAQPAALRAREPLASHPLVSCVMVTRDRPRFAAQAVAYFLAQDYPNAELVIVEDGTTRLVDSLPRDRRVRIVPAGPHHSIGSLRNTGCAAATGELVILWDDDDWHGPTRISQQVAPLLAGTADITGLTDLDWFEPASWRSWRLGPQLHRTMLRRDVYGGTIAFRRVLWTRHRFPDRSLAEDADFLDRVVVGGARLHRVSGQGCYVYIRHGSNTWQVRAGRAIDPRGWQPVAVPDLPARDLEFYRSLSRPPAAATHPLVSCIMPTRDRRAYVARSVEYFLRQDYPATELVVLDDGDDPVGDLVPDHDSIRYQRLDRRTVLGAKRNLACELATGSLIAHWDDDDWQAPDRLSVQVAKLTATRADVCGAGSLLFYDPGLDRGWRYTWPTGRRGWAAGTSLLYPRSLWSRSPFSEVAVGEDTRFVWQTAVRRVADVRADNCVVAIVHDHNTVPKTGRGAYWAPASSSEILRCLGGDVQFYQALVRRPQVASADRL